MQRSLALSLGSIPAYCLAALLAPIAGWQLPFGQPVRDVAKEVASASLAAFDLPPYEWTHAEEENAILEAVLRHQFATNPASPEIFGRSDYVFVALTGEDALIDPSPQLMARFSDMPKVLPASHSTGPGWRGHVEHKDLGGFAVMFVVDRLSELADGQWRVETEYVGGCGSGNFYIVERRDNRWAVVEGGMTWIS